MNDRNDEDSASEHAQVLEKTFKLDPATARLTADDTAANGMRKPASDDVEADRIAAANEQAPKQ